MGNCQAAEAATVVIQHPGNKIERIYWSVSAHQIMDSNPGHYVALVVSSPTLKSENGTPLKQLKLLRPDDTLLIGQVYRLITFEDVLKEFASKKCGKLGKLLKETGGHGIQMKHRDSRAPNPSPTKVEQEIQQMGNNGGSSSSSSSNNKSVGRQFVGGGGQWRPALQSIAEVGT
ncbi:uncharacterized protein LOC113858372 [Abrus precatorius]|uniref:Uncharacterized protein LOC113858372 n=1 Tax=Abrus precatorius TaxID=3816 RepID=A0A8B8KSH1_ABRPR|nr:uncharacterized protein LOC113858372 [Abrus precatorius]XP_027346800.1 uncharacterized protein LOC113858372 [Abrus precatorius]